MTNREGKFALWSRRILACIAATCFAFYLGWNVFFIVQFQVPPSIMSSLLGIPAPTTGGLRSIRYLLQGDLALSIQANAFGIPLTLLFFMTLGLTFLQIVRNQRLSLPRWNVAAWAIVLSLAWVFKLFGDREFW